MRPPPTPVPSSGLSRGPRHTRFDDALDTAVLVAGLVFIALLTVYLLMRVS